MTFIRTRPARETMLAGVAAAARMPLVDRPQAVGAALQAFAADPALLEGLACPCCPDRYVRHLLHSDPEGGYAVVALVWRPGQMSPVHGHKAWCAFAVHQGTLTETWYSPAEAAEDGPQPHATHLLRPGEGSHGAADPLLIHRLANLSCRTAISIHCYGIGYDRFGQDLNEIHAA
ncbi:cysteine dioxygenase [Roseomonas frigidaquae]|uniref:Cysteine dioxygenase n=1 Tax=Falsiroseomonas frigidaquae TaxID=487318 RepID=A0ABX1F5E0_9PROT|nr:cysteine dioxygenase family protein [Falsiroseomonas frigidaquae]NKE47562.1 cysteine dioxygenase [Falsiroseomonas frigidaquae]